MEQIIIAFIGAGNMTRALVSGLVENGYAPDRIWVSNPSEEKLRYFSDVLSVHTTTDNIEAAMQADVIVYAVKPNKILQVSEQLCSVVKERQPLILSIAAGVQIKSIEQWLSYSGPVVRAMPNTPVSVGAGATGLFASDAVSEKQRMFVETIFRSVGVIAWVKQEALLRTIIAVSGSSPAYVFAIMEAMQQAAINMGLDGDTAALFTSQSVLGAAKLALTEQNQFAKLREAVTSPQGTTQAALDVLEKKQMYHIIADAMQAASDRAAELAGD